MARLHPDRTIEQLNGGIHCVTQQQPVP
ncbi:hypothetical protein ACFV11_18240 [Streptomyces globisporus]